MAKTQLNRHFATLTAVEYYRDLKRRGLLEAPFTSLSDAGAATSSLSSLLDLNELTETWGNAELTYADRRGGERLRDQIAALLSRVGPAVSADQCLLFSGAQEALFAIASLVLSPGDEVILFTPGYQPLLNIGDAVGAKTVTLQMQQSAERGWYYPIEQLSEALSDRTRLICVNQPHNPTGALLSAQDIAALHEMVEQRDLYLLSDEVSLLSDFRGSGINSAFSDHPRVISVGVCSKSLGLSALRVGWTFVNDQAVYNALLDIKANLSICGSLLDEWVLSAALEKVDALVERNNKIISRNVIYFDNLIQESNNCLDWYPPTAGVVGFVRWNREERLELFLERLLAEQRLLIFPASCFGEPTMPYFRVGFGREDFSDYLPKLKDTLSTF